MKHAVVYIFLAFEFLPHPSENLDQRGRSPFSVTDADVLNYVCLPGIGVGDSCWEKRGGVRRGGLAKGGQRGGEEGAGEEEEAGSRCPLGYRRVWQAGGKLQPFHSVLKVHQKEGDQSELTRTPYTLFPKEAGALVLYCVCYS